MLSDPISSFPPLFSYYFQRKEKRREVLFIIVSSRHHYLFCWPSEQKRIAGGGQQQQGEGGWRIAENGVADLILIKREKKKGQRRVFMSEKTLDKSQKRTEKEIRASLLMIMATPPPLLTICRSRRRANAHTHAS